MNQPHRAAEFDIRGVYPQNLASDTAQSWPISACPSASAVDHPVGLAELLGGDHAFKMHLHQTVLQLMHQRIKQLAVIELSLTWQKHSLMKCARQRGFQLMQGR